MKVLALANAVVIIWLLLWAAVDVHAASLTPRQLRAKQAIIDVFPRHLEQAALAVSYCESRFYVGATNGQYRGLFQMGSWERRRFGHGPGAYAQARAALRYFQCVGNSWRPWSCRWAAS